MHGQIKLGATKVRGLLGYLSYRANEAVHVDRIAEVLWDGETPPDARKILQTYASRLRRVLREARCPTNLRHEHHSYRLEIDQSTVDYHEFTAIVRDGHRAFGRGEHKEAAELFAAALEIWHGPPLADLDTAWARRLRETLTNRELIPTHCALFETKLSLGDHDFVLSGLPCLLTDHPHNERLAGYWVRALAAASRASEVPVFFREFSQRLLDDLDATPSAELLQVVSTATNDRPSPAHGARKPTLPRATPYFTGRDDLLSQLDTLLVGGDRSVDVVALDGPPGVGKTTLATHWARRQQDKFPDGVLCVDLAGYSAAPLVEAHAVMAIFLDELGVSPTQIPNDPTERAARLHHTLTARKILIIFDNVRDSAHVRSLLATTASCPVLITSRQQLTGITYRDGVHCLSVTELPAADAAELVEKRIGERAAADPAATAKLVQLCQGLPLALRIVSEHIAVRATAPVDELAEELRHTKRLLDAGSHGDDHTTTLRSTFSWSYHALRPAEQRLLRLLGTHPGTRFSVRAVTALTGHATVDKVEHLLDSLVGAHLVVQERAGRYYIHDLLHLYAAAMAREDEPTDHRAQAQHRMFDWYLCSAHQARTLLAADEHEVPALAPAEPIEPMAFANADEALRWLVTERANLVGCTHLAADLGHHEHVWRFAACLNILNRYEDPQSLLAIQELGRQSATVAGQIAAAGGCLNNKGATYSLLNDHASAGRCFEMAYEAFKETDDKRGLAVATHNTGVIYLKLGQPVEAIRWLDEALAMNTGINSEWAIANTHRRLGDAHRVLGRTTEARSHYRQSLYSSQATKDAAGEAAGLARLCQLCLDEDQLNDAIRYGDAALDVFNRILIDKDGTASVLCILSTAHLRLGEHSKAISLAREAIRTYHEETRNVSAEIDGLTLLGHALADSGEPAEAAIAWTTASTLVSSPTDPRAESLRRLLQQRANQPLPVPRTTTAFPHPSEPPREPRDATRDVAEDIR